MYFVALTAGIVAAVGDGVDDDVEERLEMEEVGRRSQTHSRGLGTCHVSMY